MGDNNPDKLESWKEIAQFIERDERTAMRWAKELGMPVERSPGGKRRRVYASRDAIKAWRGTHPKPEVDSSTAIPFQPSRNVLAQNTWRWLTALGVSVTLILGLVVVSLSRTTHNSVPSIVRFTENGFEVFDAGDHKLWTHTFPNRLDPSLIPYTRRLADLVRIHDFNGNGGREVLVVAPLRNGPNPEDSFHDEVDCFSSDGKLLWSYVPRATFQFGDHSLDGPWNVLDIFVSAQDSSNAIWITAEHFTWGNSFVAQLDPKTGRSTIRFVNTGVIYALNEITTPRGSFLVAGGFNNEYDSGIMAVIDKRKPFTSSPQKAGTRHECVSCPKGSPDYYFTFPRTEINQTERIYEDAVRRIVINDTEMEISKSELNKPDDAGTIYLFRTESNIEPVSLRYDSAYDMLHRELSATNKLNHSLEDCPERLNPKPVRMWTPTDGWTDLPIKAAKASD